MNTITWQKAQKLWTTQQILKFTDLYDWEIYLNDNLIGVCADNPEAGSASFIFEIKNNQILWEIDLVSDTSYGEGPTIPTSKIEKYLKLKSFL